jgi:hypothetical protein
LQTTPFSNLLSVWDALDGRGTDHAAMRWLATADRYYLLVKLLGRTDVWQSWL